jgi:hypothetical protein
MYRIKHKITRTQQNKFPKMEQLKCGKCGDCKSIKRLSDEETLKIYSGIASQLGYSSIAQ